MAEARPSSQPVKALRLAAREAEAAQCRLQAAIDGAEQTAIFAADREAIITVMNRSAKRLLALDDVDAIGSVSIDVIMSSWHPLQSEPAVGEPRDWLIVDRTGAKRIVSVRSNPLLDPSGRILGRTFVAHDVTGRREAETLFRDTVRMQDTVVKRLIELDRARKDFITTASHELRTPLSSILGFTELLADGAAGTLSPPHLKLLSRIDRSARRLAVLAEDMTSLSDLDSGTATIVRTPMDCNSAAEQAWEAVKPYLAERELVMELELSVVSPEIIGDVSQIERALLDILTNAVRATPDGGTVALTVRESQVGVEYEVSDTGVGVPEDELPSLFEPFFRTGHSQLLGVPGTGMGLSLVRRIVEAHHGHVSLSSRAGRGTTIALSLPSTTEDLYCGLGQDVPIIGAHGDISPASPESELRLALEGTISAFVLHYEPIVDLTSGKVVAVEALAHWQHPERGLLAPDELIPLAEGAGLIGPLGDWALGQALLDATGLTHEGRELDVAINFSVSQLDDQAAAKVQRALESSGVRPARLTLEVTESALVDFDETTAAAYEALSGLGVKIAIDDFGTGHSSILQLRRHPIDALKIDRAFVVGIGHSEDDEAICQSIISLAVAVGASTVADGVETAAQHAVLRSLGCLQGQGPLWASAVPFAELDAAFATCAVVPVAAPRARMLRAPRPLPAEVRDLIARMHAKGASLHTIAGALNRTVGRQPSGVRWSANAVARGLLPEDVGAESALVAPIPGARSRG